MAKLTKKQKVFAGKVDSNKLYPLAEAIAIIKDCDAQRHRQDQTRGCVRPGCQG